MDGFTTNMKISNNIEIKQIESDFKFEYYENCSENDTSLGSSFPLQDKCNINEINIENKNCTSLWNNNTKRKSIVDIEYDTNVEDFIINDYPFKDLDNSIIKNNLSHEISIDVVDVNNFKKVDTNT